MIHPTIERAVAPFVPWAGVVSSDGASVKLTWEGGPSQVAVWSPSSDPDALARTAVSALSRQCLNDAYGLLDADRFAVAPQPVGGARVDVRNSLEIEAFPWRGWTLAVAPTGVPPIVYVHGHCVRPRPVNPKGLARLIEAARGYEAENLMACPQCAGSPPRDLDGFADCLSCQGLGRVSKGWMLAQIWR